MSAVTIAVSSAKGGVGKSSVAVNLATIAARNNYHTLLVDTDPQSGIGLDLGIYATPNDDQGAELHRALATLTAPQPITHVRENLDLIAGGKELTWVTDLRTHWTQQGLLPYQALQYILSLVKKNYEIIIIDTPPTEPTLRNLAFAAADFVIAPTKTDDASIKSIGEIGTSFLDVRDTNPYLEFGGVVLFDINTRGTVMNKTARDKIERALQGIAPVFHNSIRSAPAAAVESRNHGMTVLEYAEQVVAKKPKTYKASTKETYVARSAPELARDYQKLTAEVISHLAQRKATNDIAKASNE